MFLLFIYSFAYSFILTGVFDMLGTLSGISDPVVNEIDNRQKDCFMELIFQWNIIT